MKKKTLSETENCIEFVSNRTNLSPSHLSLLLCCLCALLSLSLFSALPPPLPQVYSWISSSDTAAGVSTPRSVKRREMRAGGV